MTAEEIELRYTMSKSSDEELLMIVGVNSADYRHEAINIAIEELTRRGLPFSSAGQVAEYYSPYPELKGVGGWLLFLCFRLTVFGPLFLAGSLYIAISTDKQFSTAFAQVPKLTVVIVAIVCSIYIVPMLFGIYAGIALWTIRKHAVKLAKIATLIFMGLNLLDIGILILMQAFSQRQSNIEGASLFWDICILGGNITWYAYLSGSKRVKNTYGE